MRPNRKHKDGMLSVASIKRQLLMPVSSRSQFERYEHNIPTTIANWFNATSLPRILAGDISVIYIGETTDAMPTPSPPINLAMTNSIKVRVKAEKTAEIKKRSAETKIVQMKETALKEIKNISVKIAMESVKKIISTSVDKSKLEVLFKKNLEEAKAELKKINS